MKTINIIKAFLLPGALCALMLSGCVVRHHGPHGPRHHNPPPEAPPPEAPPPEAQPHDRTPPPPPATPQVQVQISQHQARRGQEIEVFITPFDPQCNVFYNGRPLPKKTGDRGFAVTVPANAESGNFELQCGSQRYQSPRLTVTP